MESEPDETELEAALGRGLLDVEAGRVRPIEDVRDMIPRWVSACKSRPSIAAFTTA